jgi:D-alanine-D-alanine ligase
MLHIIPIPAFEDNYIWLLHDGTFAVVVDPGDANPVIEELQNASLSLIGILITHHHADHIGGVSALIKQTPHAIIYAPLREGDYFKAFDYQALIEGDEVTCPVLGEGDTARALPVVRIVPPVEGYDYQNKYYTDAVHYHCPSGLSTAEEAEIQALTLQAYRAIGCRGWARADIIIRAQDRKPFLLEINTAPGMTDHSLVPMSARSAGLAYPELCLQLLAAARLDSHQPTLAVARLGDE